jgi:hypothetical protein
MSVLVILACLLTADTPKNPPEKPKLPFGGTDFKQYYATSKLIVDGHNPYDHARAWQIQEPLGANEVQVPYGPPTSLLPFIPLGWLDFPTAVQVFFMVNVAMMVISCFLWGKMLFPQKEAYALLAVVTLLAWVPSMTLFWLGQVTSFVLLGFSLWLFLMRHGHAVAAGAALALCIVKPHLAAGPVLYAGLVGLRQRQWGMLASLTLTALVLALATWLIRPTIWSEYLEALPQLNPTKWYNATLDGAGRRALDELFPGVSSNWFRGVSLVVALVFVAWIVVLAWRHPLHPANAMLVLALWMAGTPYAFSYDYVLLVPCFILALGHAILRKHSFWWVAALGWITLDLYYYLVKSLGRSHGFYEDHFSLIPWGALALTLFLLPHDPEINRQDAKN